MDWSTIIVGALSLVGTCIGTLGGIKLISYRLEQLEKKVDKHNNFAERMPVVEEKIRVINNRLKDIESELHTHHE